MKKKKIIVDDKMQPNGTYQYELTQPPGRKHFDDGFTPTLTPKEMLELGVFSGVYMRDCRDEFPESWFKHAKLAEDKPNPSINFFGVRASQPLHVWRKKGWLHEDDPRGWFQWYCRYYMGRRNPTEDKRQIKRWKAFARHAAQVSKNCRKEDLLCRPRQRQALLHWAYDSRKI